VSDVTKATVFERGDHFYIVSPLSPFEPSDTEIEEFAFAKELRSQAPNPNIKWLQGQYVEADTKNKNGQMWTAGELAIKSVTPMFMPVTVMHDVRSAVGVIADTRLLVPDKDGVPRARLDNTLAMWAHRFPEVAEEVDENYRQGTLMQSMECISPYYDCAECGQTFQKLPGGEEKANWCAHLMEAAGFGTRILRGVVFTGTGLLFGTRGKEGADPKAHLEVFQDEIAEFHDKAHKETGRTGKKRPTPRRKTSMSEIEISREEYASLQGRPSKEEFAAEKERADKASEDLAEANKKLEAAETAEKQAKEEKDEAEKKLKTAEEEKAESKLRDERIEKFGDGFLAKLGDTTKTNLKSDAGKMEEEAWENRVKEVEELAGVKRDAKSDKKDKKDDPISQATGDEKSDEFSHEEVASSAAGDLGGGDGGAGDGDPTVHERASVARGLLGGGPKTEKTD
jgi:hypothetical protein